MQAVATLRRPRTVWRYSSASQASPRWRGSGQRALGLSPQSKPQPSSAAAAVLPKLGGLLGGAGPARGGEVPPPALAATSALLACGPRSRAAGLSLADLATLTVVVVIVTNVIIVIRTTVDLTATFGADVAL